MITFHPVYVITMHYCFHNGISQISGISRGAYLVTYHRYLLFFMSQAEHGFNKIISIFTIKPGRAYYHSATTGAEEIHQLNCTPDGLFPHNPEPLPENLTDTCNYIKNKNIDLGFVVDPDVDRLAIIKENGECFGEEYTLVSIADYVLGCTPGNTVSNLSSTQALKIITQKHNGTYHAAAVGEVNVVEKMKECHAVIGGEGNGGVIYPDLHYGRDALVGIALFLTAIATKKMTCSQYRSTFPDFYIHKDKIQLTPDINVDQVLKNIKQLYHQYNIIDIDGVKILFDNEWVHLRKSNTEPIIRIYAESINEATAKNMADRIKKDILNCIG